MIEERITRLENENKLQKGLIRTLTVRVDRLKTQVTKIARNEGHI